MELRIVTVLAVTALACLPARAGVADGGGSADVVPVAASELALSGAEVRNALTGNSIVNPAFGCAYYGTNGVVRLVDQSGQTADGWWAVKGDLYYSTGRCGVTGCTLSGRFPSLTFRRTDGSYEQPVIVIRGNYCEKNGVIS